MKFILPFVFMLMLILIKIHVKNKTTKIVLFIYTMLVGTILSISAFNPIGLYNVSNYTYALWLICALSFVSTILLTNVKTNKNIESENTVNFEKWTKSKFLIITLIVNLILVIMYKLKYDSIIEHLPYTEVRMARFTKLFNGAFETLFFNYIIVGLVTISSILFSVLLINKKIKNIPFWLSGITIIVYSLIGFSRMIFLNMIIYCAVTLLINYDVKKLLKPKSIIITFVVFLLVFSGFTAMLYTRSNNPKLSVQENISNAIGKQFRQVIEYTTGGLRLLNNFIQNGFEEFPQKTYGRATLAGIEEIVLYPLKGLGMEIDSFNNVMGKVTQKGVRIGENTAYFNAFYTCVMNYYLDFGILGVVFFPILHAIFIVIVIQNYNKKKNLESLLLLNYAVVNLLFSILRWNYQLGSSTFVMILLILLNLKENLKVNEFIKKHIKKVVKNKGKHAKEYCNEE